MLYHFGYGVEKEIFNTNMENDNTFELQNEMLRNMTSINENVYERHAGDINEIIEGMDKEGKKYKKTNEEGAKIIYEFISESNSKRSYWVNQRLTHLKKVKCFVENGNIHYFKSEGNKTKSVCPSCFQPVFENCIEYIMNFDYADSTIKEFRFTTIMFLKYLSNHEINTFKFLTPVIITEFFKDKSHYSKNYLKIMVRCLRRFLNYLYFEKYTDDHLSFALPEIRLIRNAFLPPIIDPIDIDELLRSIDTSLPIGKRDYAILMIAAKTGLRTSDIKRLSIHDIDWRDHTISITQKKTQIPLKVPFPKDVGWAIIDYLKPNYIVRVSATTKKNKEAEFIQIDELDVINEGLITRALYINENVGNDTKLENEHEYLLDLALEKQKEIRKEYKNNSISVNPLIIIQVPSKSDELIEQIETLLDNKGYAYKNKTIAIWLADRKENIENISENDAEPIILIMKQAISTGLDCPRAKILVKLRDNMSEDFETQTIGRIRRMPQAHHYDNVLLDNCYLYTFDEKYEETIKQELGNNVQDVKIVFLKDEYKKITLIKQVKNNDFDGFDDRETFRIIQNYFIKKYNLTSNKTNNRTILEAEGYIFGDTIENTIVQDKIIKIDSDEISNANTIKVKSTVNTSKNGIDLRHSIGVISSKIGMKYDKTRVVLERMFLKRKLFTKKFINLSLVTGLSKTGKDKISYIYRNLVKVLTSSVLYPLLDGLIELSSFQAL